MSAENGNVIPEVSLELSDGTLLGPGGITASATPNHPRSPS